MQTFRLRSRSALVAAIVAAAVAAPICAQDEALEPTPVAPAASRGGGHMPAQVVAGRLVVSCDLSTPANRIPANLFVEFEGRHGLQLHNRAAAALRAEAGDGTPRPITLHFQDFTFSVPKRELGDQALFEEFTKYHSASMGENALIGSIGVEILDDWKVVFDVANGRIELAPLGTVAGGVAPPTAARVEPDGTVVAPITLLDGMVWVPVRWHEGRPGGLMLGSALYDTRIDGSAARGVGRPAGDVGPIRIGGVDLHRYVAFRPEPIVQVHPDGVVGITGINLLEHFRVEVDRGLREVRLRETKPAEFPTADLEFFRARAAEDTAAVLAFLGAHGAADPKREGRLAHEAACLLLDYQLDDDAPGEDITAAVGWMHRTVQADLGTTRMLDLMKEMADAGEEEVVIAAGQLGIETGRKDRYPNAVHEVHGRLGRTLLDRALRDGTPADPAWRHLLSAAFGLPEDGRINLDLGRFYEHQQRYRRAFSRYIQAVIRPESGPEALEALQRVQPLALAEEGPKEGPAASVDGEDTAFSVDTIEKMIAGKVRNFGAASRFAPTDEHPARRTVLCELFTNGHFGNETDGGAIGGALGFEGLISHFEPSQVVFLEHHIPVPKPDALCSAFSRERAATFPIEQPTVMLLDGQKGTAGAGKWRDAEEIYNRARTAILERLALHGDYEVDVRATLRAGRIEGTASIVGPDEDNLVVHVVLAEARVLYPGSSGIVVHRNVVRGSLLPDDGGVLYAPEDMQAEVAFSRALDSLEADQRAQLDALEAEGLGSVPRISLRVDPREARVVAYLCDATSGAVFACAVCTPALEAAPAAVAPVESTPAPREGGR